MMRGTSSGGSVRADLRATVDARLDDMIRRFYTDAPYARNLVEGDELDLGYYKRHTIETVLRIRRKRTVDAYALIHFTKHDPRRAKQWAAYTDEEMLHDELFVRDLEAVGVTRDEVYATEPFLSTKALMGYLLYDVVYNDSPLALIASVYFIEYTTTRTQPSWIDKVERALGKDAVKGARAHVNTDIDDDHADFVWEVLVSLLVDERAEAAMLEHLESVYRLYLSYFSELYHFVVRSEQDPVAVPALL